ncbi:ATP-binding cassette sub-family C member 10-like [Ascaphus truei]|uniref:ATP-binding cassette sub-family C member 10-like n=1 Tax=Ascaphus truei TaxID=8439 RepID=UPI003F5A2DC2
MEKCIQGILRHRTRILCTHRTELLDKADILVLMDDGKIVCTGPPDKILPLVEASPKLLGSQGRTQEAAAVRGLEEERGEEETCTPVAAALLAEEEKKEGAVALQVYGAYWRAVGGCLAGSVLLSLLLMQASRNVSDWWLSHWISNLQNMSGNDSLLTLSPAAPSPPLLLFSPGGLVSPVTMLQSP